MIGGTIVQILPMDKQRQMVEVLDEKNFDRCWRLIPSQADVRINDRLWWQSFTGYLAREGEFSDKNIGGCKPGSRVSCGIVRDFGE